jgi:hypothetical protein
MAIAKSIMVDLVEKRSETFLRISIVQMFEFEFDHRDQRPSTMDDCQRDLVHDEA